MGVTAGIRSYIHGGDFKNGVPQTLPPGRRCEGVSMGLPVRWGSCVRIEFLGKGYPFCQF